MRVERRCSLYDDERLHVSEEERIECKCLILFFVLDDLVQLLNLAIRANEFPIWIYSLDLVIQVFHLENNELKSIRMIVVHLLFLVHHHRHLIVMNVYLPHEDFSTLFFFNEKIEMMKFELLLFYFEVSFLLVHRRHRHRRIDLWCNVLLEW